nr:cache domain-containing protein [Spirochaeta isovalerica]
MAQASDIPYSLAESTEKEIRLNGEEYRDTLKNDYLRIVDKMRYGNNNFFFILDGSGRMVHHPLYPELSWWNMNYETDQNGSFLFREIIAEAKRDGYFQRKTEWQSRYSKEIYEPQIIYGKYIWSWDWLICTIAYTNELESSLFNSGFLFIGFGILQILVNSIVILLNKKKLNPEK